MSNHKPLRPKGKGRGTHIQSVRAERPNYMRRGNLKATIHEQCVQSGSTVPLNEAASKLSRKTANLARWMEKQDA
jgi:hypothetical protein